LTDEKITGPWAALYDAEDARLPRAWRMQIARQEAAIAAEERRRAEERAERIEQRQDAMIAEAMRRAWAAGEPFDPQYPWKHWATVQERINEAFDAQDRAAEREERRMLVEAGLLHELGPSFAEPVGASTPEAASAAPPPASAARSSVRSKIRAFFARPRSRTIQRSTAGRCTCLSCEVNATRGDVDSYPDPYMEITRYTEDYR
jgi:hypothetical protein